MNKKIKILRNLALVGGTLCAVKGLDTRLEVTHYKMRSPKIPKEFDGFRIVQVSDYHCDTIPALLSEIQNEDPNIIVTTGDMADDEGSYTPAVRLGKNLVNIAPTYAVNGNHELWRSDYSRFEAALRDAGVHTMSNISIPISRGNAKIILSGIDDPFTRDGFKMVNRVEEELSQIHVDRNFYNILLFHRANMLDIFKDKGFDLILAGHMHGGQFRLPNGRGIIAPRSGWGSNSPILFPKYFAGHYEHSDGTQMIVNRGLGNPMIIPRLFNRPEITVIILKHEKGEKK